MNWKLLQPTWPGSIGVIAVGWVQLLFAFTLCKSPPEHVHLAYYTLNFLFIRFGDACGETASLLTSWLSVLLNVVFLLLVYIGINYFYTKKNKV